MGPDAATMRELTFGGGASSSIFNPIVLSLILLAGLLILFLPRGKAIVPFFLAAIVIPLDQVLVIGSLHFPMLRVLVLFGFARVFKAKLLGKDKVFSGGLNGIDKAMIVMTMFTIIDGILLWMIPAEFIYQLGAMLTGLGSYIVLRHLIREEEDVVRTIRAWTWVVVALATVMVLELATGKNYLYMAIGGTRAAQSVTVLVRDGVLRARGSFLHPILAGTFGGFSLPLFVGLWWKGKENRMYAAAGAICSVVMCFAASSSTALMGLIGGVIGLSFWTFRRNMRTVRRGVVALLVVLQIYLLHNGRPVWHVIVDIDTTGSSSSWHRFMLVDQCVRHFFSWMLVGTKDYGSWGWEMWDLSNQYVETADVSGLIPLIALVSILVLAFKYLGRARRFVEGDKKQEMFVWAIAASLFANLVAFIGISYFDQTIVGFNTVLAMICAISLPARMAQRAPAPALSMAGPGGQKLSPFLAGNGGGMQNMPAKVSGYNQEGRVRPLTDERTLVSRKNERSWVK